MITKEIAMSMAEYIVKIYPHLDTVEELIDEARADKVFSSEDEMLAVWGRLLRLVPNRTHSNCGQSASGVAEIHHQEARIS